MAMRGLMTRSDTPRRARDTENPSIVVKRKTLHRFRTFLVTNRGTPMAVVAGVMTVLAENGENGSVSVDADNRTGGGKSGLGRGTFVLFDPARGPSEGDLIMAVVGLGMDEGTPIRT
jgi:hypothetical protein